MEEVQLKPCPFCGGEAYTRIKPISAASGNYLSLAIKCSKCFVSKETRFELCDTSFGKIISAMSKMVDDWWNKRVDDTPSTLWCHNQTIDEAGRIICLAHLAEARVQNCPYINNEDRLSYAYPCADFQPKE